MYKTIADIKKNFEKIWYNGCNIFVEDKNGNILHLDSGEIVHPQIEIGIPLTKFESLINKLDNCLVLWLNGCQLIYDVTDMTYLVYNELINGYEWEKNPSIYYLNIH